MAINTLIELVLYGVKLSYVRLKNMKEGKPMPIELKTITLLRSGL